MQRWKCRRCGLTVTFTDPTGQGRPPQDGCPKQPANPFTIKDREERHRAQVCDYVEVLAEARP